MSDETQAVLDRVRALICYFDAPIATDPITGTPEIESDALVRKAMVREVRTLLATVDALREDARRLDWLEAQARTRESLLVGWNRADGDHNEFTGESFDWPASFYAIDEDQEGQPFATLRAAIDAARTPTPEGR